MTADTTHREFAARFARLLEAFPVSAAPFVVTLYGDVVAPRGGEIWTGNIVQTLAHRRASANRACGPQSAGWWRRGGSPGARWAAELLPPAGQAEREFSFAARLIYAPVEPPPLRGWHLVALPEVAGPGGAGAAGAAALRPSLPAARGAAGPRAAGAGAAGMPLRGSDRRRPARSSARRLAAGPARRADGAVPCRLRAGRGAAAEASGGGGAPAAPGTRLPRVRAGRSAAAAGVGPGGLAGRGGAGALRAALPGADARQRCRRGRALRGPRGAAPP